MNDLQIFDPVHARIQVFASGLKGITVSSQESAVTAKGQVDEAAKMLKEIERLRKDYVGPLNDKVKLCNAYAKKLGADLDQNLKATKDLLASWERKCAAEREAAQKQLEAARLAKEEELRVREMKDVTPPAEDDWSAFDLDPRAALERGRAAAEIDRARAEIHHEHKTALKAVEGNRVEGARRVWKFEVTDPALVPREFLCVDEKLVRTAVQAGVRELPGVRIFEDVVIAAGRRS